MNKIIVRATTNQGEHHGVVCVCVCYCESSGVVCRCNDWFCEFTRMKPNIVSVQYSMLYALATTP